MSHACSGTRVRWKMTCLFLNSPPVPNMGPGIYGVAFTTSKHKSLLFVCLTHQVCLYPLGFCTVTTGSVEPSLLTRKQKVARSRCIRKPARATTCVKNQSMNLETVLARNALQFNVGMSHQVSTINRTRASQKGVALSGNTVLQVATTPHQMAIL